SPAPGGAAAAARGAAQRTRTRAAPAPPPGASPAALQLLRGEQLALGVARAAEARVDVRQHVVAERRRALLRGAAETLAQGVLGARKVAGIEQRLGQVQVARAEIGFGLDRAPEASRGVLAPSVAQQKLGEIEARTVRLRAPAQLGLVLSDRLLVLARRLAHQ